MLVLSLMFREAVAGSVAGVTFVAAALTARRGRDEVAVVVATGAGVRAAPAVVALRGPDERGGATGVETAGATTGCVEVFD